MWPDKAVSYNRNAVIEPIRIVFVFYKGTSYSLSGRGEGLSLVLLFFCFYKNIPYYGMISLHNIGKKLYLSVTDGLGAMVYGNPVHEEIQLNEETVSAGSPYNNYNPEALVSGKLLLRIRKYLINNIFRGQTPVHDLKCLHLQSVQAIVLRKILFIRYLRILRRSLPDTSASGL